MPAESNRYGGAGKTLAIARARNTRREFRAEGKRRKRKAAQASGRAPSALGSAVAPVAFMRDAENRHALDGNPNRGKHHASRANLNLADDPSGRRARVSHNDGRRKHGQTARSPYLETWNSHIPSLGKTLSKRVPRS